MKKSSSVTIKDIAQVLGLSAKAISTGLNDTGRLAPETRRKIQETAHRMGYVRNAAARSLVMRRSYLIGVLVPYINDSFFSRIIAGMESVALEHDFSLLLGNARRGAEEQRTVLHRMMQRSVDGLILYPSAQTEQLAAEIAAFDVPTVQIMNRFDALGTAAVTVDNFNGGAIAAEQLLTLGHRRIGLIAHDDESQELGERRRGFESRLASESGVRLETVQSPMSIAAGGAAGAELLRRFPDLTAIFAASDFAALGTLQAALEAGRRIPEELALVGFDDLDIAAKQVLYPLSTLAQPKEEIGIAAVRMLLDLIGGGEPRNEVMKTYFVGRATTRSQNKGR